MRTRLRHLHVFLKMAELGSVQRAAAAVGLTQPSASHALAELEGLLACTLFQRHARGVTLTRSGQALLPFARRMLDLVHESADVMAAIQNSADGQVRIAAISSAVMGILADVLPDFSRDCPDILVQIQEMDIEAIGVAISRSDVDLVLCRQPDVVPKGWAFSALVDDHFVVIAGPQHPLVALKHLSLEQLWQEVWLQGPTASVARRVFDDLVARHGVAPQLRQISTRSPALLWAMLGRQRLISMMPRTFAGQMLEAGQLCQLDVDIDLPFKPLGVMYALNEEGAAASTLRQYLQAWSLHNGDKT